MKNLRFFALIFCLLSSTFLFSINPNIEKLLKLYKPISAAAVKIGQHVKQRSQIAAHALNEFGNKPVLRVRGAVGIAALILAYKNRGPLCRLIGRCGAFIVDSLLHGMIRLGFGTYYYLGRLGFVRGIPNDHLSFDGENGNSVLFVDDDRIPFHGPVNGYGISAYSPPTDDRVPLASRVEAYSEQEHDGECPVCLDEYSAAGEIRRLGCDHYLHDACFQRYVADRLINYTYPDLRCTVCRAPVVNPFPTAL